MDQTNLPLVKQIHSCTGNIIRLVEIKSNKSMETPEEEDPILQAALTDINSITYNTFLENIDSKIEIFNTELVEIINGICTEGWENVQVN